MDDPGSIRGALIGLTDKAKEGTFVWVDGTPLSYKNWGPSDPNDIDGTQDIVQMDGPYWSSFGSWTDSTNTNLLYCFICEKKHRTIPGMY